MKYNQLTNKTKYYGLIWSYDNFQFEYEEEQEYFENVIDAMKHLLEEKKENRELAKKKYIDEPICYFRIRKYEETDKEVYITDYVMRKYRNKYKLKRAEDIIW